VTGAVGIVAGTIASSNTVAITRGRDSIPPSWNIAAAVPNRGRSVPLY
jgi:hypothetical protein